MRAITCSWNAMAPGPAMAASRAVCRAKSKRSREACTISAAARDWTRACWRAESSACSVRCRSCDEVVGHHPEGQDAGGYRGLDQPHEAEGVLEDAVEGPGKKSRESMPPSSDVLVDGAWMGIGAAFFPPVCLK